MSAADLSETAKALRANELAQELVKIGGETLTSVAQANRSLTLEKFGPVVRAELLRVLAERFPELPEEWLRRVLSDHVVLAGTRLRIEFDLIAERILDPTGETIPPPPDTERPA